MRGGDKIFMANFPAIRSSHGIKMIFTLSFNWEMRILLVVGKNSACLLSRRLWVWIPLWTTPCFHRCWLVGTTIFLSQSVVIPCSLYLLWQACRHYLNLCMGTYRWHCRWECLCGMERSYHWVQCLMASWWGHHPATLRADWSATEAILGCQL